MIQRFSGLHMLFSYQRSKFLLRNATNLQRSVSKIFDSQHGVLSLPAEVFHEAGFGIKDQYELRAFRN